MGGQLLDVHFSKLQLLSMLWSLKKMLLLSVTIAILTLSHVQASDQGNLFPFLNNIFLKLGFTRFFESAASFPLFDFMNIKSITTPYLFYIQIFRLQDRGE